MKTTLILNESANSETITTKIGNVNPQATDAQLYNTAVALSGLTSSSFVSAVRVNETELTAPDTLTGGAE